MGILDYLKEYGQLIDITLFAVMLGVLIQLARRERSALIARHEVELASQDATISALKERLAAKDERIEFLREMMPKNIREQYTAIREALNEKIADLNGEIAELETRKKQLREQISKLQGEAEKWRADIKRLAGETDDIEAKQQELEGWIREAQAWAKKLTPELIEIAAGSAQAARSAVDWFRLEIPGLPIPPDIWRGWKPKPAEDLLPDSLRDEE